VQLKTRSNSSKCHGRQDPESQTQEHQCYSTICIRLGHYGHNREQVVRKDWKPKQNRRSQSSGDYQIAFCSAHPLVYDWLSPNASHNIVMCVFAHLFLIPEAAQRSPIRTATKLLYHHPELLKPLGIGSWHPAVRRTALPDN